MTYARRPVNKSLDISDASGTIMINFTDYSNTFDVNHGEINDVTNPGKHFKVDMPLLTFSSTLLTNEIILTNAQSLNKFEKYVLRCYRDVASVTDILQINDGTPTNILSVITDITQQENGWYEDPSGTLVKWGMSGVQYVASSTNYTVLFPTGLEIPAFTTAPLVIAFLRVVEDASAASISLVSSSTLSFVVNTNLTGQSYFSVAYIALGS